MTFKVNYGEKILKDLGGPIENWTKKDAGLLFKDGKRTYHLYVSPSIVFVDSFFVPDISREMNQKIFSVFEPIYKDRSVKEQILRSEENRRNAAAALKAAFEGQE